jgi:hypothetical protein
MYMVSIGAAPRARARRHPSHVLHAPFAEQLGHLTQAQFDGATYSSRTLLSMLSGDGQSETIGVYPLLGLTHKRYEVLLN